ncbi:crotonobetainyl-CoA--carnitine CoA-transferase [Streptomyces sp. HMX87]|uniref:crotonobetainyl-CoA--carnitine CoA-transferase n=1 Tax=Streptomyces sp. HMX87 TaxID=3390849 RepID=UPI003A8A29A6
MKLDLSRLAHSYVVSRSLEQTPNWNATLHLDGVVCRSIADWYEQAPLTSGTKEEALQYQILKEDTLDQFELLRENGVEIEPWPHEGQPYTSSTALSQQLHADRKLYVFLTSNGHGQTDTAQGAQRPADHPMLEPSPVTSHGVTFIFNDLFRAVHDAFGHAARGNRFTARGEFMATWDHMKMYSPGCHPVLLSETVGQICWFYFGPHLRRPNGVLPRPSDTDYVPPAQRPYSPQKTVPMPDELLSAFRSLFKQVT